jgi:hypothetical protein
VTAPTDRDATPGLLTAEERAAIQRCAWISDTEGRARAFAKIVDDYLTRTGGATDGE